MSATFWNHERVERLCEMWADGASSSTIAAELGCTRNTVVGKKTRLGLAKRDQAAATAVWRRNRASKPRRRGDRRSTWDEATIQRLRDLWAAGRSIYQIEVDLGISYDAIRSARKRYGLPPRNATDNGGSVVHAVRARRRSAPRPIPVAVPRPDALDIHLRDAGPGQCRFIAGEPTGGSSLCCGHRTVPGESWCEHHFRLVFNSTETRRVDAKMARRTA